MLPITPQKKQKLQKNQIHQINTSQKTKKIKKKTVVIVGDSIVLSGIEESKLSLRLVISRSSRPEVFCKEGVLRNFARFTGKQLCQSLFFNEVAGLRPAILLKK